MLKCCQKIFILTLFIPGGGKFAPPPFLFVRLSQKIFPETYDETLFLLYTYEDSRDLIWSKNYQGGM